MQGERVWLARLGCVLVISSHCAYGNRPSAARQSFLAPTLSPSLPSLSEPEGGGKERVG